MEKKKSHKAAPNTSLSKGAELSGIAATAILNTDERVEFLDSILASSTEYSIIAKDLNHVILAWNEGARRIYGYEPSEVIGRNDILLYDPQDVKNDLPEQIFSQVYKKGLWTGRLVRMRKDGSKFNAVATFTTRKDHRGKIIGYTVISRDITSQIKLEEDLIQKNALLNETTTFLNNIIESSNEYSIVAIDLDGAILTWNSGAKNNYGYEEREVIGKKNIRALHIPPDVKSGRVDKFLEIVRRNGKAEGVFERIRKDKSRFIASIVMTLRKNSNHEPIGYLLISKNITEQRRLEEQSQRANELAEESKRAREANRLKSEFLANMSHELRTPLNAIIGFSEIIHDEKIGTLNDDQREYLRDVLNSSKHLLQLINDVLDLSKVESGKIEFYPEMTNVNKLITEIVEILRPLSNKKRIHLEIDVDNRIDKVYVDPSRLKQIIYNYLSNALKFTADLGTVRISAMPESKGMFRISVKDNGIGIRKQDLERLFVEFQQLDSSAAKKYAGTGLGLALTKRLVEAQHGYVDVVSSPGNGSIFSAVLPRKQKVISQTPTSGIISKLTEKHSNIQTVLVIEDDDEEIKHISEILFTKGYRIDTAQTGKRAITLCNKKSFDLITLDLLLPDMSGYDVLRKIRLSMNANTPVVVISLIAEKNEGMGFLISDYLVKPVKKVNFLNVLNRIGGSPNSTRKIIAIDDDPMSLKIISSMLRGEDYKLICITDAKEGLKTTLKEKPDVLILDLMMPGLDGFEFLKKIRKKNIGKDIPVIIWTAKDLTKEENKFLQTSSQGIVLKSMGDSTKQLKREIKKLTQKTKDISHGK